MDEQVIKDAQYRKGLSIAFFNATNAAIEMVKAELAQAAMQKEEYVQERIKFWRNWLLNEHKEYYANVIAVVGPHFSVEDTIAKLRETTTLASLKSVWLSISADEREHPDVVKVKDEMKSKHEAQR